MSDAFRQLFDYDRWANELIHAALLGGGEDSASEVHLLGHVLAAQRIWHSRLLGETLNDIEVFPQPTLDEVAHDLKEWAATWSVYLEPLAEADLDRVVSYVTTGGNPHTDTVRNILTHVVNHGTHHRAQISSALRRRGVSPPATDYCYFTREPS